MKEKPRRQRIRQIQNRVKGDRYVQSNKIMDDKTTERLLGDIIKK